MKRKFIAKFDPLYKSNDTFSKKFMKDNKLSESDIDNYRRVTTLLCYANNGLINLIDHINIKSDAINEKSSAEEIFKVYLDTNKMNSKIENNEFTSKAFYIALSLAFFKMKELKNDITINDSLNNFDMFMYLICTNEIQNVIIKNKKLLTMIKNINKSYEYFKKGNLDKSYEIINKSINDHRELFIQI